MLEITRNHAWGRDYAVVLDGSTAAHWRRRAWRSGGRVEMDGRTAELRSADRGRTFELRGADGVLAEAHRSGRTWRLRHGGEEYTLERPSGFGRRSRRLLRRGDVLGTFTRTRFGRGLTAELGDLPAPAQVFAGLVVLSLWQRQDAATAAAVSAGSS